MWAGLTQVSRSLGDTDTWPPAALFENSWCSGVLVNNEWVPHRVLVGICQCDLKGCFASVPDHCSLIAT